VVYRSEHHFVWNLVFLNILPSKRYFQITSTLPNPIPDNVLLIEHDMMVKLQTLPLTQVVSRENAALRHFNFTERDQNIPDIDSSNAFLIKFDNMLANKYKDKTRNGTKS